MRALILGVASLAAATTATGAPAIPAIDELVVRPEAKCLPAKTEPAAPAPRIVSTFPADNAIIRPGRLVVRVTFDRPMTCRGFLYERPPLKSPCPRSRQ